MQQRQSTQPPSEQRSPRELAAARRSRALRLLAGTAATTLLALLATGCPEAADLANPGMYDAPAASAGTGSGTAGSGGSGANGSMCESECMAKIINAQGTGCKACHGKGLKIVGTLDFETAGYTARLVDKPAEHLGVEMGASCPSGDKLIDSANPSASWLLKKVTNMHGNCGTVMPATGLPAADQACVTTYVNCAAGKPGGAAGAAAGGAAAGTGGASASGSGGTGGT